MEVLIAMYANRSVPKLIVTYTLLEKVEVSPQKGASPSGGASQGWVTIRSVRYCLRRCWDMRRKSKDEPRGKPTVLGEQTAPWP